VLHHHDDQLQLILVNWGDAQAWGRTGKTAAHQSLHSNRLAPYWKHGCALQIPPTAAALSSSRLPAIHDRRRLALPPAAERKWLKTNFVPPFGHMQADVYSLQTEDFA
jgi:hypothetical protein